MPCSGPSALAVAAALVERARLRQRLVRIEMDEGVHLVVDRFDPLEAGADILLRAHVAAGDPLGGFDGGEPCQFDVTTHQLINLAGQPERDAGEDIDQRHGQEHHEHERQRAGENFGSASRAAAPRP